MNIILYIMKGKPNQNNNHLINNKTLQFKAKKCCNTLCNMS